MLPLGCHKPSNPKAGYKLCEELPQGTCPSPRGIDRCVRE